MKAVRILVVLRETRVSQDWEEDLDTEASLDLRDKEEIKEYQGLRLAL